VTYPKFELPVAARDGWVPTYEHATTSFPLKSPRVNDMVAAEDYDTLQDAADAAVTAGKPLYIGGDWTLSSTVTFLCNVESNPEATITYTGSTGPAVKVGDGTTQALYLFCHFPRFATTKTWSAGSIGTKAAIRVAGLFFGEVSFVNINGFSYGLHLAPGTGLGTAYSVFRGGIAFETAIPCFLDAQVSGSYVNENRIEFGSYGDPDSTAGAGVKVSGTRGILMLTGSGGNPINNNIFLGGALEQQHFEYAVKTENALFNLWISPRMEVPAGYGEWNFGQTATGDYSAKNLVFMGYGVEAINLTESAASFGNSVIGPGIQDLRGATSARALLQLQNAAGGTTGAMRVFSPSSSPYVAPDDWNVSVGAYRIDTKNDSDDQPQFRLTTTSGTMQWGPGGSGALDTILYRPGADHLKTDDAFSIGGNLAHLGSGLGFYGATVAAKPTVSGSRGGNAALASLITALATLGLLTDGTSA
jgi:hypothetical protein